MTVNEIEAFKQASLRINGILPTKKELVSCVQYIRGYQGKLVSLEIYSSAVYGYKVDGFYQFGTYEEIQKIYKNERDKKRLEEIKTLKDEDYKKSELEKAYKNLRKIAEEYKDII